MIESGINIFLDLPVGQLVEIVVEAEKMGYGKCWVYDEGLITRDPYIALTAMAQRTNSILLGTGITNPYTRHPGVTTASIATLDELSGGRAFLGIGSGGNLTLDPLDIPLEKPLTMVREMITTSRRLLRGETVTHDGMVKYTSANLGYGRDDIEIWLAARGPKMLGMGGELADGAVLDFVYKDSLDHWVGLIRQGAQKTGNHPKICYSTAIITTEETLEEVRPHMTYRLVNTPVSVREQINMTEADTEKVRKTMASAGLFEAGKLIKDEWIKPFVIMGDPEECAAELSKTMSHHNMDEFLVPIVQTENATRLMSEAAAVISKIER